MPDAGDGGARRDLPAMHALLADPAVAPWMERYGRQVVRAVASAELDRLRTAPLAGAAPRTHADIAGEVAAALRRELGPRLRPVLNATGVVLHTGLGRSPLPREAVDAVAAVAAGYCNLELDLATGRRGHRSDAVAPLLRALTGAEAALVVNNNAAAVLLALSAVAAGREVVIARGELIEIGGGFRIPDVMAQSGALLREVGTTNRSHLRDYEEALGPATALLLKVHQSNFRIVGFTAEPVFADLVALCRQRGLPLMYDLGSGRLGDGDLATSPLPGEPDVRWAVAAGADLVTFSGDKLLGGPQAGVICGRADLVSRCARHPLHRAVRVDKMTLAGLEATLRLYAAGVATARVPALAMLHAAPDDLRVRADALAAALRGEIAHWAAVEVRPAMSAVGGGAAPDHELPTYTVAVVPREGSADGLAARLRQGDPPVVARVAGAAVVLDVRTVAPEDAEALRAAVAAAAPAAWAAAGGGAV